MAIEITVPRLGWSMDEGTFGQWLKQDRDLVREGDALFELESDKAVQEVESFDAGVLRIPPDGPQPGDSVKVGQRLAYLCQQGERAPFEAAPGGEDPPIPLWRIHRKQGAGRRVRPAGNTSLDRRWAIDVPSRQRSVATPRRGVWLGNWASTFRKLLRRILRRISPAACVLRQAAMVLT